VTIFSQSHFIPVLRYLYLSFQCVPHGQLSYLFTTNNVFTAFYGVA